MPKMASDFLQSNLFNPTAPSEQFLERARHRRIKGSNSDLQEANRGGPFSIQFSRSPPHQTLDRVYSFLCNNNNSYAFQNSNNYRNPQSKKTTGASPQLIQPKLNSMLSEGLVQLPGPPVHSRPEFSSKAAVLATASRRDRAKNIFSRNYHQDLSIFSGTREILTEDNRVQSGYSQAYSLGQLFPRETSINLMNGIGLCTDNNSNDASHKKEDVNEQSNDLIDRFTRITPDETVEQLHNHDAQEKISLETSVPLQGKEPVSTDPKSELICNDLDRNDSLHRFPDTRKGESNNQGSDNNPKLDEATALGDAFNLLQMKTELDKLNLINKYNADNASQYNASQDIAKSLFRETLESSCSPFEQKSGLKTVGSRVTDQFTSSDEVAKVEIKPTNLAKKNKGSRTFSSKRKQLLRLLHLLLGIRWMKTTQEDKKSLVEEEIIQGDGVKMEITSKRTKKKMRVSNQTSKEQKTRTQENQNSGQGKDLISMDSTKKKKKKRRRPRKKNVYRTARRIKRSLGYGCHYIGHGLVNMTSIIPEASYLGPVGHTRTFPTQYIHNDYYDPNVPEWDCQKGPYIQSLFV